MNDDHKIPDIELLGKYLAGEATAGEAMLLHDWLADPVNKEEFDRVKKLWDQLPGTTSLHSPDSTASWQNLQQALKPGRVIQKKKVHFLHFAVAASFIGLLLIVAIKWMQRPSTEEVVQQPAATTYLSMYAKAKATADTLPDGTTVIINSGSSIAYTPAFNTSSREVLLDGESFFNVVPDTSKPFIVSVDELKIKVVGTSFNVRRMKGEDMIEVQVQSGVVKMFTSTGELVVNKGQTGIFNRQLRILTLKDAIDVNALAYATRTFSFNDLSLKQACDYLETAFNVDIKLDEAKFKECRLTSTFENKSLDYILNVIDATLNTTHKQVGDIIYVEGRDCK